MMNFSSTFFKKYKKRWRHFDRKNGWIFCQYSWISATDENGENFLISCFSQIQVLEILHVNFAVACQSNVVRPG